MDYFRLLNDVILLLFLFLFLFCCWSLLGRVGLMLSGAKVSPFCLHHPYGVLSYSVQITRDPNRSSLQITIPNSAQVYASYIMMP